MWRRYATYCITNLISYILKTWPDDLFLQRINTTMCSTEVLLVNRRF